MNNKPTLEAMWRAIVLIGRNTASYKFALAKALIELSNNKSSFTFEDIAKPFSREITEHLKLEPKQATSSKSTSLDYCRKYNVRFLIFCKLLL